MKAVFIFNIKSGKLDSFVYTGPGKVPTFIPPEDPDAPRDFAPPKPGARNKKRKERPN